MKKLLIGASAALVSIVAIVVWIAAHRERLLAPEPGVPLALAQERASRISQLEYDASLNIPEGRAEPIRGRITASFKLSGPEQPLAFDFTQPADHLISAAVNGRRVEALAGNGHVIVPSRRLKSGATNRIAFDFIAGDESMNRNDDFLYTLFVPARASLALPCFDQPDLKAPWTLTAEIPSSWTAVSNGAEARREQHEGRTTVVFRQTAPLPTYLVALAAGKFQIETSQRDGRTFRMFHRETDATKVARNRDAIFDLHARALAWMQDYTGIAYPFDKFDFVLMPAFQFSGMEHPGAIYYNASTLLLDESATQSQLLNRANTISHETAHMWFGDLVTMRWFNDVWMKEVFANFMAAKIVNPSFPGMRHDVRFLLQHYPAAYDVDRTAGANPIRQALANLNEAGTLYGGIIYDKAPIVMQQLERLMGADVFRAGLREYLGKYRFGNASWTDVIALLNARAPIDLGSWSRAWVETAGRPAIRVEPSIARGRIDRLRLREEDPAGRAIVWLQALRLQFGGGASSSTPLPVTIAAPETAVAAAAGQPAPRWTLPLDGYGLFNLDTPTIEYISRSMADISDPYVRATALVEMWELMLEDKIAPGRVIDDLLLALPRESDELVVQQMLDDVRIAFWRFTAADDRPAVAPRIEAVLKAGLAQARTSTLKGAWFEAFRRIAMTPASVDWIAQIWEHRVHIEGLTLSETDDADLAAELALRNVPDAATLLRTQLDRLQNADRKARFAFIMPALSPDGAVRDGFFDTLKDVRNRRHEPWVLDAMRYLNHPLRAAGSRKYLKDALGLTLEIQRTGDIFFPKRWADAALSGYQTVQTAAEVRAFIEALPPDYPERLRWVLLSSADQLFRAARLLQ